MLVVRGACSITPNIRNTKTIRVISIVGRLLEHSRFFYFKHGNNTNNITNSDSANNDNSNNKNNSNSNSDDSTKTESVNKEVEEEAEEAELKDPFLQVTSSKPLFYVGSSDWAYKKLSNRLEVCLI